MNWLPDPRKPTLFTAPLSLPRRLSLLTGLIAAVLILLSIVMLERDRAGLDIHNLRVGATPATLYQPLGATGPVVIVAHGFAGSRQIMEAYSLRLAQAGYRVLAYDLEGHGRNPALMSGDVTTIDGTTSLLVAETQQVIAAARALPSVTGIALLGHSMATDIIVLASLAEEAAGRPIDAVIGISLFSQAITSDAPSRLLIISGQWKSALRQAAIEAVRLVDLEAVEGTLASAGDIRRQAVVAPRVEHGGVLFSPTGVDAAQNWLDSTFEQTGTDTARHRGLWLLTLLAGIVLAARPLVRLLPKGAAPAAISTRQFWTAILLPSIAVPPITAPLYGNFLPVLVADYLMLHLAAFGMVQLALLGGFKPLTGRINLTAVLALAIWGILVFGARPRPLCRQLLAHCNAALDHRAFVPWHGALHAGRQPDKQRWHRHALAAGHRTGDGAGLAGDRGDNQPMRADVCTDRDAGLCAVLRCARADGTLGRATVRRFSSSAGNGAVPRMGVGGQLSAVCTPLTERWPELP